MENYDNGLSNIRTGKQKKKDMQNEIIQKDIDRISDAINSCEKEELMELHIYIEGKYGAAIPNLGMSAYGYNKEFGYAYDLINDRESLIHNLKSFKAKLEGFLCDFHFDSLNDSSNNSSNASINNINVNIENSNVLTVSITFEEAKKKIDDMPGLTDAEAEEIKSKIDELEKISKENINKKKKWEKVKPIISFIIDKGADVAIMIMGLILQMRLGA